MSMTIPTQAEMDATDAEIEDANRAVQELSRAFLKALNEFADSETAEPVIESGLFDNAVVNSAMSIIAMAILRFNPDKQKAVLGSVVLGLSNAILQAGSTISIPTQH